MTVVNGAARGLLVRLDLQGIPWRASTRKESPYYVPADEAKTWVILLNGKRFSGAGIVEFDRTGGWLLVKEWRGLAWGRTYMVHGEVRVIAGAALVGR